MTRSQERCAARSASGARCTEPAGHSGNHAHLTGSGGFTWPASVEVRRVLDLCSGIGGFSRGLERTGHFRPVAFCDNDPHARWTLHRLWPEVPIFDELRTLRATPGCCDAITAGIPCQPHSSATRGRRTGTRDDRFLWPEVRRLYRESECPWVCIENVAQFDGMALEQVVSDMEADGYEVGAPLEIPACAVGCDHYRPRLWILGYADRYRQSGLRVDAEMAGMPRSLGVTGNLGTTHEVPSRMDRFQLVGNAIVADIAERIGHAIVAGERLAA